MSTAALSGNDTLVINGRNIVDLADGDAGVLTYPNNVATLKTGKNGNAIYGLNESGKQAELVIRLIRASSDDKFLNGLFAQQQANFSGFPLMTGEFVKQVGDENGNVSSDTYILGGGVFMKAPEAKSNVDGDTEQSVSVWRLQFAKAARVIS